MPNPTKTPAKLGYSLLFFLPGIAGTAAAAYFKLWTPAINLACLILFFVFMLHFPRHFAKHRPSQDDYSHLHRDAFENNGQVKLTDIAMAGAHDAFTHRMSYTSDCDPTEKSAFSSPFTANAARGLITRLSKAQVSDCYTLLKKGARFLDVRICETDNGFATKHGILSDMLEVYLLDTLRFLSENKGEIVVYAIQYSTFLKGGYDSLFDYISSVKYEEKSLLDYAGYSASAPLSSLTYGSLTKGGTESAAVFLAKADLAGYAGRYRDIIYDFNQNIRITWHCKMDDGQMLEGIRNEAAVINARPDKYAGQFRVNQAQKTPSFSPRNIFKIIAVWSLIDQANRWNPRLVEQEDFSAWLNAMPVVFVDYLDCGREEFNRKLIEKIQTHNFGLKG